MNLREIKKDIEYVLGAFIEDCSVFAAVNPNAADKSVEALIDEAVALYNELKDKVNAFEAMSAEAEKGGAAPVACANVAAGRTGDLEYLAFIEKEGEPEDTQICLFVVNTSGERMRLKVNLKSKSGLTGPGFRRRLTLDAKTGGMSDRTTERVHDPLKPFCEWVEPGEITFMDFRI